MFWKFTHFYIDYFSEHYSFRAHGCSSGRHDYQVPICPLCTQPIPNPPNASPDETVSRHIDQFCPSERRRIFTNRCSHNNCKRRELVAIKCHDCNLNFCVKHRHNLDHDCDGPATGRRRVQIEKLIQPTANHLQQVQGNLTEEQAFNRAVFLSLQDSPPESPPILGTKDRCSLS